MLKLLKSKPIRSRNWKRKSLRSSLRLIVKSQQLILSLLTNNRAVILHLFSRFSNLQYLEMMLLLWKRRPRSRTISNTWLMPNNKVSSIWLKTVLTRKQAKYSSLSLTSFLLRSVGHWKSMLMTVLKTMNASVSADNLTSRDANAKSSLNRWMRSRNRSSLRHPPPANKPSNNKNSMNRCQLIRLPPYLVRILT